MGRTTPTTVYAAAVMTLWHLKPAQLMPVPTTHETASQNAPCVVHTTPPSRPYSPLMRPMPLVGTHERPLV